MSSDGGLPGWLMIYAVSIMIAAVVLAVPVIWWVTSSAQPWPAWLLVLALVVFLLYVVFDVLVLAWFLVSSF